VADLQVIVPSRGRPGNIERFAQAWRETTGDEAEFIVCVDNDDPFLPEYKAVFEREGVHHAVGPRRSLAMWLNVRVGYVLMPCVGVGFMGDDHLPRTHGWAKRVLSELRDHLGMGVVYGNDLLQGEKLPTAAFIGARVVSTLGWMVPPGLEHLYIDNAWKALGEGMGCLRYLPDVILEHMHPDAGKAQQDETYRAANSGERDYADRLAFEAWRWGGLPGDLAKLREAALYS
jgi:hypothetical protein